MRHDIKKSWKINKLNFKYYKRYTVGMYVDYRYLSSVHPLYVHLISVIVQSIFVHFSIYLFSINLCLSNILSFHFFLALFKLSSYYWSSLMINLPTIFPLGSIYYDYLSIFYLSSIHQLSSIYSILKGSNWQHFLLAIYNPRRGQTGCSAGPLAART